MKREVITNPQLRKHELTSTETLGKTFPKFWVKKSLGTLSLSLSLSLSHTHTHTHTHKVMNLLQVTKVLGSTKTPTSQPTRKERYLTEFWVD
jgi:hypothetical protein